MGAQSFDPAVLAALERVHQPEAVRAAFAAARGAGYANVNLDLIYGAHGETLGVVGGDAAARRSRSRPSTCRAYALTIEPATPLGRAVAAGDVPEPDPDLQADMFAAACEVLGERRLPPLRGLELGEARVRVPPQPRVLGAAAVPGAGRRRALLPRGRRWWNARPPEEYMARVERGELPIGGEERLEPADAYLEEVFLRLRILEGIPRAGSRRPRPPRSSRAGSSRTTSVGSCRRSAGMLLLNELVLGPHRGRTDLGSSGGSHVVPCARG